MFARSSGVSGVRAPLRVLIVEDESLIALNLELLLVDLGLVVIGPFATARDAYRAADIESPDLAMVDLNLVDGPTGLALAQHLASAFQTEVVITTANPDDVRSGSFQVVRKPYTDESIKEAVQKAASSLRMSDTPARPARLRVDSGA